MKKTLIFSLLISVSFAASAHSHGKKACSPKSSSKVHVKSANVSPKESPVDYIGTNDFNLALIREGVKKA